MNQDQTYTLAELAEETGLTERTVRYYIERVLPPHHKQGRGKLARYGQDTLSCIRFIVLAGERYGFKPGQARGVLASVPQETIDRVVRGEEELTVMAVPSAPVNMQPKRAGNISRPSKRMEKYSFSESRSDETAAPPLDYPDLIFNAEMPEEFFEADIKEQISYSMEAPAEPWQTIFADRQLRIQCRGKRKLTSHQQDQVEAAARLIELALR